MKELIQDHLVFLGTERHDLFANPLDANNLDEGALTELIGR